MANLKNIELEEINSRFDPEEGWNDIFLKIIEDTKTDTSHIYVAKGLYNNKTVGLQIEVDPRISAGIVNGKIDANVGFVSDAVQLKTLGQESDEFIKHYQSYTNTLQTRALQNKQFQLLHFH